MSYMIFQSFKSCILYIYLCILTLKLFITEFDIIIIDGYVDYLF